MKASPLARYKKAVRAAHKYADHDADEDLKYFDPKSYKRELKREEKWEELAAKAEEILEELSPEEEEKAIDWLYEHDLFGYHCDVA